MEIKIKEEFQVRFRSVYIVAAVSSLMGVTLPLGATLSGPGRSGG